MISKRGAIYEERYKTICPCMSYLLVCSLFCLIILNILVPDMAMFCISLAISARYYCTLLSKLDTEL